MLLLLGDNTSTCTPIFAGRGLRHASSKDRVEVRSHTKTFATSFMVAGVLVIFVIDDPVLGARIEGGWFGW